MTCCCRSIWRRSRPPRTRSPGIVARWSRSIRNNGDVLALASSPASIHACSRAASPRREFERPAERHRQAAVQPRAARHLPVRLDHQAGDRARRRSPITWSTRCAGVLRRRRSICPAAPPSTREYHNEHHGNVDLRRCDRHVLRRVLLLVWRTTSASTASSTFMAPFGYGALTGIDIGGEKPGILPSREWKGRHSSDRPTGVVPGRDGQPRVGQGYLLRDPAAARALRHDLAARGKILKPRLVTGLRDPRTGEIQRLAPVSAGEVTGISAADWDRVVQDMVGVTQRGTAAAIGHARLHLRRQDRHRPGLHRRTQRAATTPRPSTSGCSITPGSSPSLPRTSRALRSRAIEENGGFGRQRSRADRAQGLDAYLLDANGKVKPAAPASAAPVSVPAPGAPAKRSARPPPPATPQPAGTSRT